MNNAERLHLTTVALVSTGIGPLGPCCLNTGSLGSGVGAGLSVGDASFQLDEVCQPQDDGLGRKIVN